MNNKQTVGSKIGENALVRLTRVMKNYENELGIVDGKVSIVLNSDGSGTVFAPFAGIVENGPDGDLPVFDFLNTGVLVEFLEANQLRRTLMIRN